MTAKHLQSGTDADEDNIAYALAALAMDIFEDDVYCEAYETTVTIEAEEAVEYELSLGVVTSDESRFTEVFEHHAINDET